MATLVEFGGTSFDFLRARRPATARSRLASRALHPPSAARYVVGGIPPSSSRLHLSAQDANRPRVSRFCRPPRPRSRLTQRAARFLRSFLRGVVFCRHRLVPTGQTESQSPEASARASERSPNPRSATEPRAACKNLGKGVKAGRSDQSRRQPPPRSWRICLPTPPHGCGSRRSAAGRRRMSRSKSRRAS